MTARPALAIPASDPSAWLARTTTMHRVRPRTPDPVDDGLVDLSGLLGDGPRSLRAGFDLLRGDGVPSATAATYLVGWFAVPVAEVVGLALVGADAGLRFDLGTLRWRYGSHRWPEEVHARGAAVVAEGHPWSGSDDATVVTDEDAVVDRAIDALAELLVPIVEGCRRLTRVGGVGLWNEIADGVGMALTYQRVVDPTPERVARLHRATSPAHRRWRARPTIWDLPAGGLGTVHVGRKGGCCLAYTDPRERRAGQPHYCETCRFRSLDDVGARQVAWHEGHATVNGVARGPGTTG